MDDMLEPSLDGEGIPDLLRPLPEKVATGDAQEGIYPPQDDYVGADAHGVTAAEEQEGAVLDERLRAEIPDPALEELNRLGDEQ